MQNLKMRRALLPAIALLVAMVGTAAAQARPAAKSPGPLAALIAQSKKESGLVFYGNPPTANFNALLDRFHYYYPWIKTTSYDLDDNTIFSKYASEAAQSVRTADVLIASAPNLWVYAARKKYLQSFTPQDIDKYPSFVKQLPGVFVMSPDPAIIVYNKLILKDKVPTSLPRSRPTRAPTARCRATAPTTPSATPPSTATCRRRAGRTSRRSASG